MIVFTANIGEKALLGCLLERETRPTADYVVVLVHHAGHCQLGDVVVLSHAVHCTCAELEKEELTGSLGFDMIETSTTIRRALDDGTHIHKQHCHSFTGLPYLQEEAQHGV